MTFLQVGYFVVVICISSVHLTWAHLLIVDGGLIVRRNLDGSGALYLVNDQQSIDDIDYDYHTGYIYWSNQVQKKIMRKRMGQNEAVEEFASATFPGSVCVDWLNRHLYYTDIDENGVHHIMRRSLDHSSTQPYKFISNLYSAYRMVVDPIGGYLYFIDHGIIRHPGQLKQYREFLQIERAKLSDPGDRLVLADTDMTNPTALAIDYDEKKLYWSDSAKDTIEKMDFTGQNRETIFTASFFRLFGGMVDHPYGITVYKDKIYWTEPFRPGIIFGNKDGSGDMLAFNYSMTFPSIIKVFHREKQPGVPECAASWYMYNHHCYLLHTTNEFKALEAERYCQTASGTHLVSINSYDEQQFIISKLQSYNIDVNSWWTSGKYQDGDWIWTGDNQQINSSVPEYTNGKDSLAVTVIKDHATGQIMSLKYEGRSPNDQLPSICEQMYSVGTDHCSLNNGNCQHECINSGDSYYCMCHVGYRLHTNHHSCVDIDECETIAPCKDSAQCKNTQGSYECECASGLTSDDEGECVDVDECVEDNGGCQHRCVNTLAGHHCECYWGFDIQQDMKTCVDTNECSRDGICSQNCTNTEGSYACSCEKGHVLKEDGKTCEAIKCEPLPDLEDFTVVCYDLDNLRYGSTCTVICFGDIIGSSFITCNEFGQWEIARTQCINSQVKNSPPTRIILSTTFAMEHTPAGSAIAILTTDDPDEGDEHTFTLNNYKDLFHIVDSTPPSLVLIRRFDFETYTSYNLSISVYDHGSNTSIQNNIIINIVDQNDPPSAPRLTLNQASFPENLNKGSQIGTLDASDQDKGQDITFRLVDNEDLFEIIGHTLTVIGDLDYEEQKAVMVTIAAYDNGIPQAHSVARYTINIDNVNEPPIMIDINGNTVEEYIESRGNINNGTVVGMLSAVDEDVDDTHTFTVVRQGYTAETGRDYQCFRVNGNGRAQFLVVQDVRCFDYEKQKILHPIIQVTDSAGNTYQRVIGILDGGDTDGSLGLCYRQSSIIARNYIVFGSTGKISLIDKNDPPKRIILSANYLQEHATPGTIAGLLFAMDEPGDRHTFTLVTQTSLFIIKGNALQVNDDIDYEGDYVNALGQIILTVKAFDQGGMFLVQDIVVQLVDIDDTPDISVEAAPNFVCDDSDRSMTRNGRVQVCVPENTPGRTLVAQVKLSRNMTGLNLVLNADTLHFALSGRNIYTTVPLDFERTTNQVPVLHIRATDSRSRFQADIYVVVKVMNVNDPPVAIRLRHSLIPSDVAVNSVVGTFICIDQDRNDSFTFSMVSTDGPFIVDPNMGTIQVTGALSKPEYRISAQCFDKQYEASPLETGVFTLEYQVETNPDVEIIFSVRTVQENIPVGSVVGSITIQQGSNPRQKRSYDSYQIALENEDHLPFTVQEGPMSSQWQLIVDDVVDYEDESFYNIVLKAFNYQHTVFQNFTIMVMNVKEPPSDIILDVGSILEGPLGRQFGIALLLDVESGEEYEFSTNSSEFALIRITGIATSIYTKVALDYEHQKEYQLYLTASNTKDPTIRLAKSFAIHILNQNEAPTSVLFQPSKIKVSEHTPIGTTVGTVKVIDPDTEPTGHQCVLNDGGFGWFMIQHNFGLSHTIRVNSTLNYEDFKLANFTQNHKVNVTVRCRDRLGLGVSNWTLIEIVDANDPPIAIINADNSGNFTIPEIDLTNPSISGRIVAILEAIDLDGYDYGKHKFSISNTWDNMFLIAGDHLLAMKELNYETRNNYTLNVTAKDNRGGQITEEITIYVLDVNEAPYNVSLPPGTSVEENANPDTLVGQLVTLDHDHNQKFMYTLQTQHPPGALKLRQSSLYVANNTLLDYETIKEVIVTIISEDNGVPPLSRTETIHIPIQDVNDPPTDMKLLNNDGNEEIYVFENATTGDLVANILVEDPDSKYFFCSLNMDAGGRFQHSSAGGWSGHNDRNAIEVAPFAKLDFEKFPEHNITVFCLDHGGKNISRNFTVKVRDSNDAPLGILLQPYNQPAAPPNLSLIIDKDSNFGTGILSVPEGMTFDGKNTIGYMYVVDEDNLNPNKQTHSCFIEINSTTEQDGAAHHRRQRQSGLQESARGPVDLFSIEPIKDSPWKRIFAETPLDYETKDIYSLVIKCTDSGIPKKTVVKSFQLIVINQPDPPTDIILNPSTVTENRPAGQQIGQLTIVDADLPSNGYMISMIEEEDSPFYIANSSLFTKRPLNFEAAKEVSVRIQVTEIDTPFKFTKDVIVEVKDAPEKPCCLTIDETSYKYIPLSTEVGDVIGKLAVEDPDEGDDHTFDIWPLKHGDDTASKLFNIIDGNLILAQQLSDVNTTTVVITPIQATDSTNLKYTGMIYIAFVQDPDNPKTGCDEKSCNSKNSICFNGEECKCLSGFTGPNCELSTSVCVDVKCPQNGKCYPKLGSKSGYACYCDEPFSSNCNGCIPGYSGDNCEVCSGKECATEGASTSTAGNDNALVGYIVGGVIAILLLVIIILLLTFLIRRQHKKKESPLMQRVRYDSFDGRISVGSSPDVGPYENPIYDTVQYRNPSESTNPDDDEVFVKDPRLSAHMEALTYSKGPRGEQDSGVGDSLGKASGAEAMGAVSVVSSPTDVIVQPNHPRLSARDSQASTTALICQDSDGNNNANNNNGNEENGVARLMKIPEPSHGTSSC